MKVIDLLNKIANGEEVPNRIIYQGHYYYNVGDKLQAYYENTELVDNLFLYAVYDEGHLNDEIEIIEDTPKEEKKIPEKLIWNKKSQHNIVTDNTKKTLEQLLSRSEQLKKSINEIIDYLESKEK